MFRNSLCKLITLLIITLLIGGLAFNASAAGSTLSISSPSEWSVHSWDDSLTIRWNSVSGAAGYYVTIKDNDSSTYYVQNKWTTSTSFSAGSYLPSSIKTLKIWVGAVSSSSNTGAEAFTSDIIYIYNSHEPDITNGSASSITETSATLSMTINKDYGYEIEDWGFYVGTSSSVSKMERYSYGSASKGTKSKKITGLSPNTKYYYRAFAENAVGEEYTGYSTFITDAEELDDPVITYPVDGNTYANKQSIKLQWRSVSGASGYRYHIKQLSGDPDRSNNNEAYINYWKNTTTSTYYTLSASNIVGGYWYKFVVEAYASGVDSSWSDWVYVWIEKDTLSKPSIIYPTDNTTITANQDIPLQWSSVSGAEGYTYSIKRLSGNPDRTNNNEPGTFIANQVKTTSRQYTLPASEFKPGYWYKFVVSAYATGAYEAWSDWVYVKAEKRTLGQPSIIYPTDNTTIAANQDIPLQWSSVSGAEGYTYSVKRLSGNPNRSNNNEPGTFIVNQVKTTSRQYKLPASEFKAGYWYKFVVSAYANGADDAWSEWVYVYAQGGNLEKPVIVSPIDTATYTAHQSIKLDWNSVSNATSYKVFVKRLDGMPDRTNDDETGTWIADGVSVSSSVTEYTVLASNVTPGKWYKFVVEALADGMTPSWSTWTYCYVNESRLGSVEITSPTTWSQATSGNSITVKWNSVNGADGYWIYWKQLSGMPDTSNDSEPAIYAQDKDCKTALQYTVSSDKIIGGYWYKFVVKAYASSMQDSWSNWVYVYVPENGDLDRPVITSPVARENYEAGKDIRFTWAKVDNATSYTYYVKQLVGEPDYSDNEEAANSWTGTTRATGRSFTLSGSNVQANAWYKFVVKAEATGYNSSWSRYTYIKIPEKVDWVHLVWPDEMESVNDEAFAGNKLLRTFDASNSILSEIGSMAFANCTNLQSVNLPINVDYIADDAFDNCPSLKIHCIKDSYAEDYANRKGIPVEVHGVAIDTDVLQVSQSEWIISTADAASTAICVTSSDNWSASSNVAWLSLSIKSGASDANVILNATKNTTNASRTGKVTFTCGRASAVITVVQNASTRECGLKVSIDTWVPTSNVLSRDIFVESDNGFTVSSNKSWLTYTKSNGTVTAKVTASALSTSQTGILTITCSDCGASKTVTVTTKGDVVAVPTNLLVRTVDPETLEISWDAVAGASYVIERSESENSGYSKVKDLSAGTTSFMDSGLVAGRKYYYRIYAQKTISSKTVNSERSKRVDGITGTYQVLKFSGAFSDENVSASGLMSLANLGTLSWTTVSTATNYKVSLRNTDTNSIVSNWENKSVGNINSISLSGLLSEGTSYRVWVGAFNQYDHKIGQSNALEFTVKSNAAEPTLSIDSITPSTISNSGSSYFTITISATNAHTFIFDFSELQVWEGWDKEHDKEKGYQTKWTFDGADDFSDKWTYGYLSPRSTLFYLAADTPKGSYDIAITAIGDGGDITENYRITVTDPSVEEKLKKELSTSFARTKQLSGDSSYNGYCGRCTGYQLWAVGLFDSFIGFNGNDAYDTLKDRKPITGDTVTLFPGQYKGGKYTITEILNLINDSNNMGEQTYAVFGFHTGSASVNGQTYGHVLLVHSVYNGNVYWCESFGAETRVNSIQYFANYYKSGEKTFHFDGAIVYGYKGGTEPQTQALTKSKMISNLNSSSYFGAKKTACVELAGYLWDSGFSPEYIAGVLANILAEGSVGKFENITGYTQTRLAQVYPNMKKISQGGSSHQNYIAHMNGFSEYDGCGHNHSEYNAYSNKFVYNGFSLKSIDTMLRQYQSEGWNAKFGLGTIQWTGGRTINLLKYYHDAAGNADTITEAQCRTAEMKYTNSELLSDYYNTFSSWNTYYSKATNAAYCAGVMITQQYVKPAGTHYAAIGAKMLSEYSVDKTRGDNAQSIYSIMIGQ